MNRFDHCVGDETVPNIDISLEPTILKNEQILPSHIKKEKHLVTGLSWDNFDINIEILFGANTIHHTYGIYYQNICPCSCESITYSSSSNSGNIDLQK